MVVMAKRIAILAVIAAIVSVALLFKSPLRAVAMRAGIMRTVDGVLAKYGPATKKRFGPIAGKHGIAWPPRRIYLLAFNKERRMEVWAAGRTGAYVFLAEYPVLGISGGTGPKTKEGEKQVPEGFYKISALNPNSRYHLSLRVDYPNAEDIKFSAIPRNQMGGDIYVHGSNVSIGCLAMGDTSIEEIFCLVAWAMERKIMISPIDLRSQRVPDDPRKLYPRLKKALKNFPR